MKYFHIAISFLAFSFLFVGYAITKSPNYKMKTALVLIYLLSFFQVTVCHANYEKPTISSEEEIVSFWNKILSDTLDIAIYESEMEYWYVNRFIMVNQSFGFETINTETNEKQSQLIIHFSFNRWHNRFSPKANSAYKYENRTCGFKSIDDALVSTANSDFDEANYNYMERISRKMSLVYILKNEAWVLEGGNDLFEKYIGQYVHDIHNAHLFSRVLLVPIK